MDQSTERVLHYVPQMGDFHTGYIFEMKYNDDNWVEEIFNNPENEKSYKSTASITAALQGNQWEEHIRTKYLDADDLMAEEFTNVSGNLFKKKDEPTVITLSYLGNIPSIVISNKGLNRYIGFCYSWNELIQLLSWLRL